MTTSDEKDAEVVHEFKMGNGRHRKYKTLKEYLKEYCECSSIQGLNYMIKDISLFERLWWIMVFILCLGGCAFMIVEIYQKWIQSPVMVSLATRDTPIYEIPFPAVTICPETKIRMSCINYTRVLNNNNQGINNSKTDTINFDYMSTLCEDYNHEEIEGKPDFFNNDIYGFLKDCTSFQKELSFCKWLGKRTNCKELFKPILTDEGLCYSFNMLDISDIYTDAVMKYGFDNTSKKSDWDVDDGYPEEIGSGGYPRRAFLAGAKNSILVVFFTKKQDIVYTCREFAYQGIRVSLHMPSRVPRPSQIFFNVGLDRMVTGAIVPTMMFTSKTVRSYSPEMRKCFFSNERSLKYFKIYSQNNCQMECYTNYTLEHCGCVAYFMPKANNTPICGLPKQECLTQAQISYPTKSLERKLQAQKLGTKEELDCDCLPICTDLNYNLELSNGVWDWAHSSTEDDEELKKMTSGYHASAVRIFFKSNFFLPMERNELYGPSDFISNFGGILGLFTGFSLFSLAEIVYFLSVKMIENYRHHGYWAGQREE